MILNELTDIQVADAYIDQNQGQRRQDANKSEQQVARERAAQYAADRSSNDPLKLRIAQLRQQLALLIQQDRQRTEQQAKQNQGTAPTTTQAPAAGTQVQGQQTPTTSV